MPNLLKNKEGNPKHLYQKSHEKKAQSVVSKNTNLVSLTTKNWKKKEDKQFQEDFEKLVSLIQLSKMPDPKGPINLKSPELYSNASPNQSPLMRNQSTISNGPNFELNLE